MVASKFRLVETIKSVPHCRFGCCGVKLRGRKNISQVMSVCYWRISCYDFRPFFFGKPVVYVITS